MLRKVLISIDDSAMKDKVLKVAHDLLSFHELDITLLHVTTPSNAPSGFITADEEGAAVEVSGMGKKAREETRCGEAEGSGQALLETARIQLRGALKGGKVDILLLSGKPDHLISATANDGGYDLLVMGYRGGHRFMDSMPGSTAYYVMRNVQCPTLLVK